MSTQQDIYAAGSESRPPMLNKENYVPWSSRLLRCETAQEIWLRVQQMMKGLDIRIQEKKAKLFNEWEMFT
nr:ribonuclease H-like domain-containing protein [Tanacetum cinerariifolium]